jgi:hypothetical protein
MRRAERRRAEHERRAPRTVGEIDYLLGIEHRHAMDARQAAR